MTEPATATSEGTLRRIGDAESGQEGAPLPTGLRRIGEPSIPAPAPASASPAAPAPARALGTESLRRITPPVAPAGDAASPPPAPSSVAAPPEPVTPPAVEAPAPDAERRSAGRKDTRRSPSPLMAGAAALAVILVAAVVILGVRVHSQDNTNSLRSSALSAATSDGVLLSSYDYRNLTGPGSAWSKVEKAATPVFRRNFLSTSGTLGKLLTQYNATATGKVVAAGIATFSSSRAVVLLFIDQTVNNTVQKTSSATQPLRTQVTLIRQGGKWLINDLQVPK